MTQVDRDQRLELKYHNYINWMKKHQDLYGFVETDHCDSTLFSGLLGCIPDVDVDITAAFNERTGKWHRRPLSLYDECWPEHSKSTISRDMFLGIAYYCLFNGRLDISEQIIKYALKHFGVMGKGTGYIGLARINIMPSLLATFAWISYKLGGPSRAWLRWIPANVGGVQTGYRAHLQVLHIMLRRHLTGNIGLHNKIIMAQSKRQTSNPLFQIAAGYKGVARRLLSDPWLWPEDRLPTKGDRKAAWLPQKDLGENWKGCREDPEKEHYGGDFTFCHWLIKRGI